MGQENKPSQAVPYAISAIIGLIGIPAAMAIAILRRRLFDIDVIISRALLFALLPAGVTAVYAAIVLGIGTFVGHRSDPLLTSPRRWPSRCCPSRCGSGPVGWPTACLREHRLLLRAGGAAERG